MSSKFSISLSNLANRIATSLVSRSGLKLVRNSSMRAIESMMFRRLSSFCFLFSDIVCAGRLPNGSCNDREDPGSTEGVGIKHLDRHSPAPVQRQALCYINSRNLEHDVDPRTWTIRCIQSGLAE